MFYVYIYRDPSRRNEPIYVGKGCGLRAYDHLTRKDAHPFTHRLQLMKRNGIEPIINVVDMTSEALAHQCEIDTIARFGRKDLGRGPVLNMTDGGEGTSGCIPSPETRQKQSAAKKGENHPQFGKKGEKSYWFGKSLSPATRKKQSDAMKGKSKPIVTCPHCGKEGGKPIMQRYHFDNCKLKDIK